ncbi:sugar transferase [Candidatus Saccharibacteria bacterium]|nr:sugar transferase [Candidatus Saccharibacteria bacterium]
MKRNPHFVLRVFLLLGDVFVIILSFGLAYFYRTHYDIRPYVLGSDTAEFIITSISLLPIWIILLFVSGVYDRSIYPYRPKLYWRLLVVSAIGMMSIIAFSYFTEESIFPARLIAVYAFLLCFVLLVIEREIISAVRRLLLRRGVGMLQTIVIGNSDNTRFIVEHFNENPESGYKVVGVISEPEFIPISAKSLRYRSLSDAMKTIKADMVIQTDEIRTEKIYFDTVDHHMSYMYIPSQKVLLSHTGEMQIMGAQPIISVRTTPLMGWSRVAKRTSDIVLGSLLLVAALTIMVVVAIIIKLSEPKANILYKTVRLSRFGKEVKIFKFRSLKNKYNKMSPEEAFEKMGKPKLSKLYRANGDQLDNDPRISTIGRFIRTTSLDELPQLLNVVKGDISLVGPRALVPEELNRYHNKNLILSVKSGLTGLAQVSGRRSISFEERRSLDIYYIQNWSLSLDMQILLKTVATVILRRGAR